MKTKKVFISSSSSSSNVIKLAGGRTYKIIGIPGNDHCTCFDDHKFGILKNGLGLENKHVKKCFFSDHTVFRCKNYLIKFFHNKFGGVWTDKRRTVEWNWGQHPEYLYFLNKTKKWINAWGENSNFFYDHPKLNAWVKTLSFDNKAIVISYWLIINE